MMSDAGLTSAVPVHLRVHLTHALLQYVADTEGIDLLHIKGPALHTNLLQVDSFGHPQPRNSTDADVLVRPDSARAFTNALLRLDWRKVASFTTGSPFEHAASVWSDSLGYADIHRFFPGIGLKPAASFAAMWAEREELVIAHRTCPVPSERMQRLILLLHAARGAQANDPDKQRAWDDDTAEGRSQTRALAEAFEAQVAFAAAVGELDQHVDSPEYDLWLQFSTPDPHNRTDEWRARIKAARSPWQRASLMARSSMVNRDRITMELGREPTAQELRRAWFDRVRRAGRELFGKRKDDLT